MNTYMISIELPEFTPEFIALIPKQRAHIDELMDEGKILQYSLSYDRSNLWVIVASETEESALKILSSFPLIRFMKPTITPLAFHNSVSNFLPKLIMN